MRITVISPYVYSYFDSDYGPTPGGAQRQQYLISKQLLEQGHQISFIVGDFGQSHDSLIDGITLIKGAPTNVGGALSIGSAAARLLHAMKSSKPDLFLVRGSPKLTAATYCCTKVLRKPLVFRLANDSDIDLDHLRSTYSTPVRRVYQHGVQDVAAVMAQTKQQQSALKHQFDIDSQVVTNAYDLPPSEEIISHSKRQYVLWVGTSEPYQKKPDRFLNLARNIPNESFKMISRRTSIAKGYHSKIRQKAKEIPNLEFVGEVSPDEIHEYYRRAKVLINTSDYEGFPNTFLEAWRYETPVVSLYFDLDGTIENQNVGLLSGDIDNLERDTEMVIQDIELQSQMGTAGRRLVGSEYSLESVASKYEEIFEKVVDGY